MRYPRKSFYCVVSLLPLCATPAFATLSAAEEDKLGIWSIQTENDAVSTLKGTSDQYYTAGLRLNWTSGADQLAPTIAHLNDRLLGEGTGRISLGLQQLVYTPRDTQAIDPPSTDRPYAGLILGTANLIKDTARHRRVLGIQLGVMGPAGLGEQLQNGFHKLIGDTPNRGWRHQLRNLPVFQVQAGQIWRLPLLTLAGVSADALPAISGAAGDYRDYADTALTFRIGQHLSADFGNATIGPGLDGTDAWTSQKDFAWYVYAGVEGQAVAYDLSLQGNPLYRSPSVKRLWDVGLMHAGLAIMWGRLRLSYSQNWETARFVKSKAGLFNYGSVKISTKF